MHDLRSGRNPSGPKVIFNQTVGAVREPPLKPVVTLPDRKSFVGAQDSPSLMSEYYVVTLPDQKSFVGDKMG